MQRQTSWEQAAWLTLALAVFLWTLLGTGIVLGYSGDSDTLAPHFQMPIWSRAIQWYIPATFALITLVTGRWASVACALLMIGPIVRIGSYLWAWAALPLLAGTEGLDSGWYSALFHVPLVWLVVIIALLTRPASGRGSAR